MRQETNGQGLTEMAMEDAWDIWDDSAPTAFWGSREQLDKLTLLVSRCIQTVTESSSARQMVLETWLVLDYAVRDLVVSGYDLYRFSQDDFDLRYELLPTSFRTQLQFLRRTLSCQRGAKTNEARSLSTAYSQQLQLSEVLD
jgi:hypothetical protein